MIPCDVSVIKIQNPLRRTLPNESACQSEHQHIVDRKILLGINDLSSFNVRRGLHRNLVQDMCESLTFFLTAQSHPHMPLMTPVNGGIWKNSFSGCGYFIERLYLNRACAGSQPDYSAGSALDKILCVTDRRGG